MRRLRRVLPLPPSHPHVLDQHRNSGPALPTGWPALLCRCSIHPIRSRRPVAALCLASPLERHVHRHANDRAHRRRGLAGVGRKQQPGTSGGLAADGGVHSCPKRRGDDQRLASPQRPVVSAARRAAQGESGAQRWGRAVALSVQSSVGLDTLAIHREKEAFSATPVPLRPAIVLSASCLARTWKTSGARGLRGRTRSTSRSPDRIIRSLPALSPASAVSTAHRRPAADFSMTESPSTATAACSSTASTARRASNTAGCRPLSLSPRFCSTLFSSARCPPELPSAPPCVPGGNRCGEW